MRNSAARGDYQSHCPACCARVPVGAKLLIFAQRHVHQTGSRSPPPRIPLVLSITRDRWDDHWMDRDSSQNMPARIWIIDFCLQRIRTANADHGAPTRSSSQLARDRAMTRHGVQPVWHEDTPSDNESRCFCSVAEISLESRRSDPADCLGVSGMRPAPA